MDHIHFKANQTAASYVADGLDEATQEAFELHMIGCAECVDDVEIWRAIRLDMHQPRAASHSTPRRPRLPAFSDWRMAASLLGAGVVGAAGGWVGKSTQVTDLDSSRTAVFSMPSRARGDDCTALRFASDTQAAVLRVPGLSREQELLALDAQRRELSPAQYSTRTQPDGSRLVRFDPQVLRDGSVQLEARGPNGSREPLGCVTGETPAPEPGQP
ncbi:MAG TPA: hypothetical protein VGL55_15180 [Steroidobacteraceae bacterium]|jgi:hypothetical protein